MSVSGSILTIGTVAAHFGVRPWHVRRLFERGLLPEPARVGAYRVVAEDDLPAIEAALRRVGYLREGEVPNER